MYGNNHFGMITETVYKNAGVFSRNPFRYVSYVLCCLFNDAGSCLPSVASGVWITELESKWKEEDVP